MVGMGALAVLLLLVLALQEAGGRWPRSRDSCACGLSPESSPDRKIVGGVEALPGEFPWAASLEYMGSVYCGAVVVSDRIVLTAAHCLKKRVPITVRLGGHSTDVVEGTTLIPARASPHPHYGKRGRSLGSDIAVLRLNSRIKFSERLLPACLPPPHLHHLGERVGDEGLPVVAVGWGLTVEGGEEQARQLQKVQLNVVNSTRCFTETGYKVIPEYLDSTMLCAWGLNRDACGGDSGGPLVTWDTQDNRWVLVGVISFGVGCGRRNYPGVYSRVSDHLDWIQGHLASSRSFLCV